MIVKNESAIIETTLKNIIEKIKIDYYVISDTGSSDNTIDIITNFFSNNNIKGEIYKDQWENFSINRTKALNYAFNKSDYLLIFDADDEICGNLVIPKPLTFDLYNLVLKSGNTTFERPLLISNKKRWKFESVVHEYLECCDSVCTKSTIYGDYYIAGNTKGARSKNPYKYLLDALTLEKAFYEVENTDKTHLQSRYAFYCGNSYNCCGNYEKAIEWYMKRLTLEGYIQEKYMTCINLSRVYIKMNQKEKSIYYLIKSFNYDKTRIEGLYEVIKQYIIDGENDIAYNYYLFINTYYENNYNTINSANKLFIDYTIYNFYLPYYIIILSERLKLYDLGILMYKIIFTKLEKNINEWWIKNLLFNIRFFIDKTEEETFFTLLKSYIKFLLSNNYDLKSYNYDYLEKYII
jgi:tetratricopeptide (TPR) repeat protein